MTCLMWTVNSLHAVKVNFIACCSSQTILRARSHAYDVWCTSSGIWSHKAFLYSAVPVCININQCYCIVINCYCLLVPEFLANVNSRWRSIMLSPVCRLSVTFVRPTQAVQIFGNISTALGTLVIQWHPLKISRRSSQGNPSAGGVKHKSGSQI